MKISEMIKELQEIMEEHGDLDAWYQGDVEIHSFDVTKADDGWNYVNIN